MEIIIYLSHTRTDIAYAVSLMNQFMHKFKEMHLQTAYRILYFLKGTSEKEIIFKRNNVLLLKACTDVGYKVSLVDRRSTFGYYIFHKGNYIA